VQKRLTDGAILNRKAFAEIQTDYIWLAYLYTFRLNVRLRQIKYAESTDSGAKSQFTRAFIGRLT
jgi:hypothetical protein